MSNYNAESLYKEHGKFDHLLETARYIVIGGAAIAIAVIGRNIENDPTERNPLPEDNNQAEIATPVSPDTPDVYILPDAGSSGANPVSSAEAAPQD